jgi:hypothetical protein
LRAICRDLILQGLIGSLKAFLLDALNAGFPEALYERPRKRKNFIDHFAEQLS